MSVTATYEVAGMSCEHCVNAVTTELRKLAGVHDVRVHLEQGTVDVESDDRLDRADVAAAVDEAGYELAP